MQSDLYNKIMTLLEDTQNLDKYESARFIEAFINNYLELKKADKVVTYYDLTQIKHQAINAYNEGNPKSLRMEGKDISRDPDNYRTVCWLQAVTTYLSSTGSLNCKIKLKE